MLFHRLLSIPAGPSHLSLWRHLRFLYRLIIARSGITVVLLRMNRMLVYDTAYRVALHGITPADSYHYFLLRFSTGHCLLSLLSEWTL